MVAVSGSPVLGFCRADGPSSGPVKVTETRVAERPLENIANNSSLNRAERRSDLRKRRYSGRAVLWRESGLKRVRDCGRVAVTPGGNVGVRLRAGVAGFAGLATCGSVWADPVCNAKVMARRALEIGAAVEMWQAQGGRVGFVTLTMRHRKGQSLLTLWDALSRAWGRVTSGVRWTKDREAYGVSGWLRVVEVTYGKSGWHVHVHALVFLAGGLTEPDVAGLHLSMFSRWSAGLAAAGVGRPLMVGQDAKVLTGAADADLARYFTKSVHGGHRIGLEFTASQTKAVRTAHGTRPVWALLDDVIDQGDADALDLWHEWERSSKGRRQLTWSQGFRALLGLAAEETDEAIAGEELGSRDDELVLLTAAGWAVIVAGLHMVALLEVAEKQGLSGVRSYLDLLQADYVVMGERAA